MKLTTFACILSTFTAASHALTPQAAETAASASNELAPEPTPMLVDEPHLDPRQAGANHDPNAAATAPSQYPIATTDWVQTSLQGGLVTYVPVAYTQKFSSVPDQLPSPGVGQIGYGTLQSGKNKRQAEATVTGSSAVQPIAVVLRTALVTQPVQRIALVQITSHILETSLGTVFVDLPASPTPSSNTTAAESPSAYGTGPATYGMGNATASNGTGIYSTGFYGTATGLYGSGTAAYPTAGYAHPTTYNRTLPFPVLRDR